MLAAGALRRACNSLNASIRQRGRQDSNNVHSKLKKSSLSYRTYSSIRKRSTNTQAGSSDAPLFTDDRKLSEQEKRILDKEFDTTFFRKPKVLIIGTDVAAMTLALSLQAYKIKPDILDTGHYMHPLAPTNVRASIVPMNAMRVFDHLRIRREIESIGSPLTLFGRTDSTGKKIASVNFESLRSYQDRPTLGVNYLELERKLQELVATTSDIQPQCFVESIESPLSGASPAMAEVKWQTNYASSRTSKKGLYDAVIISEGPFSPTRERLWPQKFDLNGMASVLEAVIPRPIKVMKGYASDQWGGDRRVGFYPVGHPNQDLLYVYAHVRPAESDDGPISPEQKKVPATRLLEHFQDFAGPWKDISETIGSLAHVNSTVLLTGGFIKDAIPQHNRIVALGDSAAVLPAPCFGHELGIATESASFLASALAINSAPVLAGLLTYGSRFSSLQPILDAAKTDVQSSTLVNTRLPKWVTKFLLNRSHSDAALVNQEIDYLNLKLTKQEELESAPISKISTLRDDWAKKDEVNRQRAKDQLKAEYEQASAKVDEHFATVLALERQRERAAASKAAS